MIVCLADIDFSLTRETTPIFSWFCLSNITR